MKSDFNFLQLSFLAPPQKVFWQLFFATVLVSTCSQLSTLFHFIFLPRLSSFYKKHVKHTSSHYFIKKNSAIFFYYLEKITQTLPWKSPLKELFSVKLQAINLTHVSINTFRTAKAATNDNHRPCLKPIPQVKCH